MAQMSKKNRKAVEDMADEENQFDRLFSKVRAIALEDGGEEDEWKFLIRI